MSYSFGLSGLAYASIIPNGVAAVEPARIYNRDVGILDTLGLPEVLIIAFIVILIVGARRLPKLFDNLRESMELFLAQEPLDLRCNVCGSSLDDAEIRCPTCGGLTIRGWSYIVIGAVAIVILIVIVLSP